MVENGEASSRGDERGIAGGLRSTARWIRGCPFMVQRWTDRVRGLGMTGFLLVWSGSDRGASDLELYTYWKILCSYFPIWPRSREYLKWKLLVYL